MKIFAISVVKNEADIIAENLLAAAQWADKIFVLDNGSTDRTWEIVQSLASDIIMPYKQDFSPFHDGIRAQVFNAYRHLATSGDWWCYRLDADEFYADCPRTFLATVPKRHHFVAGAAIIFTLTKQDHEQGTPPTSIEHMRYHNKRTWSEARFLRHRPGMLWAEHAPCPKHMGILHSRRIKIKHYPFRSFEQAQQRVAVRRAARAAGFVGFSYSADEDINTYLIDKQHVNYYAGGNEFVLEGSINNLYQRWYDVVIKTVFLALGVHK